MNDLFWHITNDFESKGNLKGQPMIESFHTVYDVMHYMRLTDKFFHPVGVAFYAIDQRTGNYLYVSDNFQKISGYKPHEFLEGGIAKWKKIIHPDDRQRILNCIEKEADIILNDYQQRYYVYNGSYRIISSRGSIKQVFHQSTTYRSQNVNNLLEVGMITESPLLKKETPDYISVEKITKPPAPQLFHNDATVELSEREKEIDALLERRYSSKQISTSLNISIHTVNAHRRKINVKKCSSSISAPRRRKEKMKLFNQQTK